METLESIVTVGFKAVDLNFISIEELGGGIVVSVVGSWLKGHGFDSCKVLHSYNWK